MAHPSEIAATAVVLVVAAIAVALTIIAVRAQRRSGNPRLRLVATAFAMLAIKGLLVAAALQWGFIGHEHLELVSSLFDLAVVVLLALPLLR